LTKRNSNKKWRERLFCCVFYGMSRSGRPPSGRAFPAGRSSPNVDHSTSSPNLHCSFAVLAEALFHKLDLDDAKDNDGSSALSLIQAPPLVVSLLGTSACHITCSITRAQGTSSPVPSTTTTPVRAGGGSREEGYVGISPSMGAGSRRTESPIYAAPKGAGKPQHRISIDNRSAFFCSLQGITLHPLRPTHTHQGDKEKE
jgi:hypothetical protein